ncbi:hypothetical protein JST97_37400 [bacterium]|nr:hypothetical protein [bacterium]
MSFRRGSSLGMVIVALTLGSLLIFGSLSAGLQQMEWTSQLQLRARARDAAESVLQLAMAKLAKDPTFGLNHAGGAVLRLDPPVLANDCHAVVSFDSAVAAGEHIPVSTNNLNSESSGAADGRTIPARSCHLVALGSCFSQKLQIETVYVQPPYPSGCASSGPVKLKSVRLWGLPANQTPVFPLVPNRTVPAHVYTNCNLNNGLEIGPQCEVIGDAACQGGITVDPSARVLGEVRPYSGANPVPHFDLNAMYGNIAQYIGQVPYQPGQPIRSCCVLANSLNVAGDLELAGGILALRGDLTVTGAIKGQGFILATGNVTAQAGASVQATDKLALLAGGDLSLSGSQTSSFTFNGLVYSQGAVTAHDLTVLGTLVCDSSDPTKSIDLQRVDLVQTTTSQWWYSEGPKTARGIQIGDTIQTRPDPNNPGNRIFFGSVSVNYPPINNNQPISAWPVSTAPGFVVDFTPPTATITIWPGGSSTTVAYNGSMAPPFGTNLSPCPSRQQLRGPAGQTEIYRVIAANTASLNISSGSMDHLKDKLGLLYWQISQEAAPQPFSFELNNLIPPVERIRQVLWIESSPTR